MSKVAVLKAIGRRICLAAKWAPFSARFHLRGHAANSWRVFTHMTPQERLLLYRLGLQQAAGATLLEVGSYLGASACFLAAAASEVGGGAKVHCVDTWRNDTMSEGARDTWAEFCANTQHVSQFIVPHRGSSADIAATFAGQIDLLFLDGDHSYEGCRTDVQAWLPHLKPGGVLIMHDYGWAEGVQQVIRELIAPRQTDSGHVMQNTYWTRI